MRYGTLFNLRRSLISTVSGAKILLFHISHKILLHKKTKKYYFYGLEKSARYGTPKKMLWRLEN
jgi:hypothetical protein